MFKILLVLSFLNLGMLCSISELLAQKYDQNWLIGSKYNNTDTFNNNLLSFIDDSVFVIQLKSKCNFVHSFNLTFSDYNGNLLFYTDGSNIYDANNILLENGNNINKGAIADIFCSDGYPSNQAGIILPTPGSTDEYDFITYLLESTEKYGVKPVNLLSHHINCVSGKCIVENKNSSILQDIYSYSNLMACKHANGVDWWIIIPKAQSNSYYKILLDNNGFHFIDIQSIGKNYESVSDWDGQAVFSIDGLKYARYDRGNDLSIFDFNRCNGILSNPVHITINDSADTVSLGCGLSWAPNNKYLYASSGFQIYQFDVSSIDISSTKITVADYSNLTNQANFYFAQLAPNNKIYITNTYSNFALHVINKPDLQSLDCQVIPNGLKLTSPSQGSIPFYPNYRLGPIACKDTIIDISEIQVYHNPSNNKLTVEVINNEIMKYQIKVFDVVGRLLYQQEIYNGKNEINLSILPAGIFFYQISELSLIIKAGKLINCN